MTEIFVGDLLLNEDNTITVSTKISRLPQLFGAKGKEMMKFEPFWKFEENLKMPLEVVWRIC